MKLEIMQRIKNKMLAHELKISVAESLTTGNVQSLLGAITGSSDFYEGGITAYKIDHKVKRLKVNRLHAQMVNCVSSRVAREMAKGVCKLFNTQIGIATTGYAETPSDPKYTVPTAFVAICVDHGGKKEFVFEDKVSGDGLSRTEMQKKVARIAIEALDAYLEKLPKIRVVSQLHTESQ